MKIYEWRSNLLDYELTAPAKLTGFILSEYYRDNKKCYPAIRTITEVSGFGSSNTILKAIKELEENNLIKIEKYLKKGWSRERNSYVFVGVVSPNETSVETSVETSPSETEITKPTKRIEKEETPPLDSSHLNSTPLYPLLEEKNGVLKKNKKSGGVGDVIRGLAKNMKPAWTTNDVLKELNEQAVSLIRQNSPDWDLSHLAGVYVSGINGNLREPPKSVRAAFPMWCRNYTKGKRP